MKLTVRNYQYTCAGLSGLNNTLYVFLNRALFLVLNGVDNQEYLFSRAHGRRVFVACGKYYGQDVTFGRYRDCKAKVKWYHSQEEVRKRLVSQFR